MQYTSSILGGGDFIVKQKQPTGLYVLAFTEVFERLSFYTLSYLLVLYASATASAGGNHQEQKNAAALFLGIYFAFDQQDVLNKISMRVFLKLFDVIFHQYHSQTFQKRIQKQVDHLARYSQKFGFFFKKTPATNVISLVNLMRNQHQSKSSFGRTPGLTEENEGVSIPCELIPGLIEKFKGTSIPCEGFSGLEAVVCYA